MSQKVVILGTAHLDSTPGKCAPDDSIRECVYSREIINNIKSMLEERGFVVCIDFPDLSPKPEWTEARNISGYQAEQDAELAWRVKVVNEQCIKYGTENCIYVSIHLSAASAECDWHGSGGWCAYTTRGKTKANLLAECLYDAATANLVSYAEMMEQAKLHDDYDADQTPIRVDSFGDGRALKSNLYILTRSLCHAVMTENLFMDNKKDVAFLLSNEGRRAIEQLHVDGIIDYFQR